MNANPYTIMLSDPAPAFTGARSGLKPSAPTADDSFAECMPRVADYNDEWTAFIEQHSMQSCWASRDDSKTDVLPRVWNVPHF